MAQALVGVTLLVDGVGGVIVETEAYDANDPASHSFKGLRPSNVTMFGPPAHAYVYRSYGIHWCFNIVCNDVEAGSAVLIRALEPTTGTDVMAARRGVTAPRLLCSGPGRLCQALGIDRGLDGASVDALPFELHAAADPGEVIAVPRIGITRAQDVPWRFCATGSPFLSRPIVR